MLSRSAFLWLYIAMSQTAPISHTHLPLASLIITFIPGLTLSIVNSHRQPWELRVLSAFQERSAAGSETTHFSLLWPTKIDANLGKPYPGRTLSTHEHHRLKSSGSEHLLELKHSPKYLAEGRGWYPEPFLVDTGSPNAQESQSSRSPTGLPADMCQSGSQQIGTTLPLIGIQTWGKISSETGLILQSSWR